MTLQYQYFLQDSKNLPDNTITHANTITEANTITQANTIAWANTITCVFFGHGAAGGIMYSRS